MIPIFTIPGRLPSLNEVNDANRTNPYEGARLKRDTDYMIRQCIRAARPHVEPGIVQICIGWYEPNAKRDPDNIESARKFILDAMVKEHILVNDSRRWLWMPEPFRNHHEVDRENPRVEVFIRYPDPD